MYPISLSNKDYHNYISPFKPPHVPHKLPSITFEGLLTALQEVEDFWSYVGKASGMFIHAAIKRQTKQTGMVPYFQRFCSSLSNIIYYNHLTDFIHTHTHTHTSSSLVIDQLPSSLRPGCISSYITELEIPV